jgi:hypothetical protein
MDLVLIDLYQMLNDFGFVRGLLHLDVASVDDGWFFITIVM